MAVQSANWSIPTVGLSPFISQSPIPPYHEEPLGSFGPVWQPFLSNRYFEMVRSFSILIELPINEANPHGGFRRAPSVEVAENKLYEVCDQLQKLMGRLELVKPSILKLDVEIVLDEFNTLEEAMAAAQLLLRPFRRLHQVVHPNAHVKWKTVNHPMRQTWLDFSTRHLGCEAEDAPFHGFLRRWVSDLSKFKHHAVPSAAVEVYWHFRALAKDIMRSKYHGLYPVLDLESCLKRARVSREADDLVGLQATIDEFMANWTGFVADQKRLEERVACSIEYVNGLLRDDLRGPMLPPFKDGNKGKGRVEDAEVCSWTDQDGTVYTQENGKTTIKLLTPSLVSYLAGTRKIHRYERRR